MFAGTGEQVARLRAVAFFRFAVVVLATFNIWIFTRAGGAIKYIRFPDATATARRR